MQGDVIQMMNKTSTHGDLARVGVDGKPALIVAEGN